MALAETAKLVVDLSLKGNFARAIGQTSRSLDRFDTKLNQTESRAYRAGQQIGTGIKRGFAVGAAALATGAGLIAFEVNQGLQSLVDLEAQTDATNAAIKSTGGVAGITAGEVRKMAEEFESVNALFGDEVIQSAENMLLAFTNIRKKAFKPALQAALDLNAGLGKSPDGLAGTARILGIALNDPTKGLGRLSRAGITFTKEQIKRIKNLQKEGKLYEAQNLILKEVEKRFGGRGAAFGGETARKVAKFHDAIEDLQRTLAVGFLPVVSNIADALSELFADPSVQQGVKDFGENLAALFTPARIKEGIGTLKDIFSTIASVAGPAASAVGLLVSAFNKIPPDLRNILIGAFAVNKLTGGLVTNIAGGIGQAFKNMVTASMNVEAGVVNVAGGVGGGVPGAGAAGKGGIGTLGKLFLVGEAIGLVAAVNEVRQAVQDSATEQAQAVHGTLLELLSKPNTTDAQLLTAMQGVDAGINALQADPLAVALVSGPALTELQQMRDLLANRLPSDKGGRAPSASLMSHLHEEHIRRGPNQPAHGPEWERLRAAQLETRRETSRGVTATNATKDAITANKDAVVGKIGTTSGAIQNTTRSAANNNAAIVSSSIAVQTGAIVGAIYAARPIVNVTNVTRSTTIQQRYGPGNGSSGSDALHNAGGH